MQSLSLLVSGGGFAGAYGCGVLFEFQKRERAGEIRVHHLSGVSAGALLCALYCCDVSLDVWNSIPEQFRAHPHSVLAVLQSLVDEFLPEDAHLRCTGRLWIKVSHVDTVHLSWTPQIVNRYPTRKYLMQMLLASCAIPHFIIGDRQLTLPVNEPALLHNDASRTAWSAIDGWTPYRFEHHPAVRNQCPVVTVDLVKLKYPLVYRMRPVDEYIDFLFLRGQKDAHKFWAGKNVDTLFHERPSSLLDVLRSQFLVRGLEESPWVLAIVLLLVFTCYHRYSRKRYLLDFIAAHHTKCPVS